MAFRNPLLDVEPYQESQVTSPPAPASPDELKAFYSDMERQDLERKLSRSKAGSRSIWSRKSLRKKSLSPEKNPQEVQPPRAQPIQQQFQPQPPQLQNEKGMEGWKEASLESSEKYDNVGPPNMPSRSIIPDSLTGSPLWHIKEIHGTVPLPVHRGRYPLHNPFGPRWYKNHHLIPPRPAPQNLSFFSSSFPSIPPSSLERLEDHSKAPGPSRTPSGSPLPTPTSSQTGIADNAGRNRSRKTSQTAPDTVDLLDVTDPWGTNWHHQSPYDVGLNANPNGVEAENLAKSRQRMMAPTTNPPQTRHKTVSPSPLSQSTSAIHLQFPQPHGPQEAHKLSKPRRPVLDNSLDNRPRDSNNPAPQTLSLPANPNRYPSLSRPDHPQGNLIAGKPYSALPVPTRRKERRLSLLGRLASLLRKPTWGSGDKDDWQHVDNHETKRDPVIHSKHSSMANIMARQSKTMVPVVDAVRPQSLITPAPHDSKFPHSELPRTQVQNRPPSPASLDAPVSLGRLTIANPDEPSRQDSVSTTQHGMPSSAIGTDKEPRIPVPPKDEPIRATHAPQPHTSQALRASPHTYDDSPLPPPPRLPSVYPGSPQSAPTIPSEVDLPWPPSPANAAEAPHSPSSTPRANAHQSESVIPFPVSMNESLPEIPSLLSPPPKLAAFPLFGTDSPLSTASLLVNPPTPHVPETPVPKDTPDTQTPPTRPPLENRRSSQEKQGNGVTRQTETFRLVRSSSGNLYPAGEKIVASGRQWEVVESESPRRSKTKDKPSKTKERESGSRKEHRHQDKTRTESVEINTSQRRTSQTRHRSANGRVTDSSSTATSSNHGHPRTQSTETRLGRGNSSSETADNHREHKSSRRRDEERTSDRKRHSSETRPNGVVDVDKPQPARPPPSPGVPFPVRREPSITARPTSGLPSSAELSALRARDVWDMERLWKGRSMYEVGPAEYMSSPAPEPETIRASTGSYPASTSKDEPLMTSVHGSSHTSYVVHPSYPVGQVSYPNIYHSMPIAPPTIVYASPPSQYAFPYQNFYVPSSTSSYVPSPDVSSLSPSSSDQTPISNPLPAPPRESPYTPSLIPPMHTLNDPNARSTDYWTKYGSVQTAH